MIWVIEVEYEIGGGGGEIIKRYRDMFGLENMICGSGFKVIYI